MIYVINADKINDRYHWLIFESHTESTYAMETKQLKELIIKYKDIVKLVRIDESGAIKQIRKPNLVKYKSSKAKGAALILIAKIDDEVYKVIDTSGNISYIDNWAFRENVDRSNIANCGIINTKGKITYEMNDIDVINTDKEFEGKIHQMYAQYIAKSAAIGLDNKFQYRIAGREVILTKFLGTGNKVILPNFITTLLCGAFNLSSIQQIKLNNGIKFIGKEALSRNNLEYIEVPESVELMFDSAFVNSIVSGKQTKVKILGTNTIVI